MDELKIYAKEYFHLAKSVPGIVSRVRDRAIERNSDLVNDIEKNIAEETEHIGLWKQFASSLGVSEQELESYQPHAKVQQAVSTLETLAEKSLESGVAAMYAMELDLPAIAKSKKDGLSLYYGLTTVDAHKYFDEHLNEEEHFAVWRKIPINQEQAQEAVEASLAAQHQVLDGVCEACGMDMMC